jgi:hypothetical protein
MINVKDKLTEKKEYNMYDIFEIIDMNNSVLRFESSAIKEYFYEIEGEGKFKTVKVFKTENDWIDLVTIVFCPVRIDHCDLNTCLSHPVYQLRIGAKCRNCGHVETGNNAIHFVNIPGK